MKSKTYRVKGNYVGKVSHGVAPIDLKVYSSAMALDSQFRDSTQKVTKMFKLTDCSKVFDGFESLLYNITMAQEMKDHLGKRVEYINEGIDILRKVEMRVRMLWNNGQIKSGGFAAIMEKEDEAMRQLVGWRNSTMKQMEMKENI